MRSRHRIRKRTKKIIRFNQGSNTKTHDFDREIKYSYRKQIKKNYEAQFLTDQVLSVFGSVVVIVFQSAFNLEKHANNIFLIFKNYFDINTSK